MVIMLNTSYKASGSNTDFFVDILERETEKECKRLKIKDIMKDMESFTAELKEAEALVIGAPLYVDGLPSQAVKLLEKLYEEHKGEIKCPVYVVSNLGFYESKQIHVLLDIVKNWCEKMDITYGGGLAIGAGGMMSKMSSLPLDKGPNRNIGRGIKAMAAAIETGTICGNIFANPVLLSRRIYIAAAHTLWAKEAKKQKLTVKKLKSGCREA